MSREDDVRFDYQNLLDSAVGAEHGLTEKDLEEMEERGKELLQSLLQKRAGKGLPFMELPHQKETVEGIKRKVQELKERYQNVAVLGIGGSALGTLALAEALLPHRYPLLHPERGGEKPRLFVLDNIDPESTGELLERIPPEETLYNVVSKSGGTAESMAQFLVFREAVEARVGDRWPEHFVITTDPERGDLRKIAKREGITAFSIPPGVGGRFSVLTPVGLFPAALVGLNIEELLEGAGAMEKRCRQFSIHENPALFGALASFILDTRKGKHITVLFSYSHALRIIGDWFRQLWAESLGKRFNLKGEEVYTGQTPVRALGVTDQHSQVQLYTEGPNDKMFTFFAVKNFRRTVLIPRSPYDLDSLTYLGGKSLNQLMDAERRGTEKALTLAQRPNATFTFPAISAYTVGQIFFSFMVQTALAGMLHRIDPFDQPGVEAAKVATYALLGRKGFEGKL